VNQIGGMLAALVRQVNASGGFTIPERSAQHQLSSGCILLHQLPNVIALAEPIAPRQV